MAKSDMMMGTDEIAAMEAALDPGTPETEAEKPAPKQEEPEIEFVAESEEPEETEPKADKKAKGEPKPKDEDKPGKQRMVPHEAMHAERKARERAEQERDAERLKQARLEERLNLINEALERNRKTAEPKAEQDPPPDRNADPIGYMAWLERQHTALAERIAQRETAERDQQAQQREFATRRQAFDQQQAQVRQIVSMKGQEFAAAKKEDPGLDEAYQFLLGSLSQEFTLLGHTGYDQQGNDRLAAALQNHELNVIMHAHQQGIPIGEYVRNYAQARGWAPKDGEAKTITLDRDEQGRFKAEGKIDRMRKAQDASETLSNSGGSSPGANKMSFDMLDRMTPRQIEDWVRSRTTRGEDVDRDIAKMMGL